MRLLLKSWRLFGVDLNRFYKAFTLAGKVKL